MSDSKDFSPTESVTVKKNIKYPEILAKNKICFKFALA